MHLLKYLFCLAIFVFSACSDAAQEEVDIHGETSPAFIEGDCGDLGTSDLSMGDIIQLSPVGNADTDPDWRYVIQRVTDGVVEARAEIILPGGVPNDGPTVSYREGVIPVTTQSGSIRRYQFEDDAGQKVRNLRPGDSIELQGTETSNLRGQSRTIQGLLSVTLLRCGSIMIGDSLEPVHVYDIVDFRRALTPSGETIRRNQIRTYVADRLRWEVANEAEGGRLIATQVPPAN